MPSKPPKTKTEPGLGLPRMDSAEMQRVRTSFRQDVEAPISGVPASTAPTSTAPKRIRDSVRREEDPNPTPQPRSDRPAQQKTASWQPEAETATRRKRESRAPVVVDDVGAAAVKLARTTRRESAPKLIASRGMIAKAPIDTRTAFVLSLIDGRNTVDAIVDMAGMPEAEVRAILARLARLGLITLP